MFCTLFQSYTNCIRRTSWAGPSMPLPFIPAFLHELLLTLNALKIYIVRLLLYFPIGIPYIWFLCIFNACLYFWQTHYSPWTQTWGRWDHEIFRRARKSRDGWWSVSVKLSRWVCRCPQARRQVSAPRGAGRLACPGEVDEGKRHSIDYRAPFTVRNMTDDPIHPAQTAHLCPVMSS